MRVMNPVPLSRVALRDEFWLPRQRLVRDVVLPYQWEALNDRVPGAERSGTIDNFRIAAGEKEGSFFGYVFQDSDLAKWLETVGFALQTRRDPALEALADEAIDLIGRAQTEEGYFNTYYQIQYPGLQWTNVRDDHEMYVAGHYFEAAVAYYEATGKPRALDIARKFADHLAVVFGEEEGKKRGYCGHPEIELALVKLARTTGERKYADLSRFFVEERGRSPLYFDIEMAARAEAGRKERVERREPAYFQAHAPIREQTEAEGHAVRAVYLFSGATDIADEYGDESLLEAVKKLWDNTVNKRMYVTGGIGSSDAYEAFSFDYDLPNERAYAETCASIGLFIWGHRLLQIEADSRYADVMEQTLYNGLLSGISLDGRHYFYVNPLEAWPVITGKRDDMRSMQTRRQPWFGCACCPPNIARLIASLGQYIYSTSDDTVFVHLYAGSSAEPGAVAGGLRLEQRTRYPWDGTVELRFAREEGRPETEGSAAFRLALRKPGWCEDYSVAVNGEKTEAFVVEQGYLVLEREWRGGDTGGLRPAVGPGVGRSPPQLRGANGKAAIRRGPVVYCLEETDNGPNLKDIELSAEAGFRDRFEPELLGGVVVVESDDARRTDAAAAGVELYTTRRLPKKAASIRAVPYFAWANRDEGEMAVWIRERDG